MVCIAVHESAGGSGGGSVLGLGPLAETVVRAKAATNKDKMIFMVAKGAVPKYYEYKFERYVIARCPHPLSICSTCIVHATGLQQSCCRDKGDHKIQWEYFREKNDHQYMNMSIKGRAL